MKAFINEHQLKRILSGIQIEYKTFAVRKVNGKYSMELLEETNSPQIPAPKSIMSFKNILKPGSFSKDQKIAFVGLPECDTLALIRLLKEFDGTGLLPKRENVLIISAECKSDEFCFCTSLPKTKLSSDLHLQTENDRLSIFALSKKGEGILKKNFIKITLKQPKIRPIQLSIDKKIINTKKLAKEIDNKEKLTDFWQSIANNCFGCGACSTVCPLCFCLRQKFSNNVDGGARQQYCYDSCFSKSFSEIQNHFDLRPKNINRLYNWYHHKFVRAYYKDGSPLCTGCGRCVANCPAHLNQEHIIRSVLTQDD